MASGKKTRFLIYAIFLLCLVAQGALSLYARPLKARWGNVPPAPADTSMASMALGDRQFAYRSTGVMLQNLGNTGGVSRAFKEYDYKALGRWLFLADKMDPVSEFVPYMAAFYFGATQEAEDLTPIVDYLAEIGQRPEGQKWRWLAQAVYLARFEQNDLPRALALADRLAVEWKEGRPAWMKQMPVFVMQAQGDKDSAYRLMVTILREEGDQMKPQEVNFMRDYICNRILTADQKAVDPLCAEPIP